MVLKKIEINDISLDPSTEIRFATASARADGGELLCVCIPFCDDEKALVRFSNGVKKLLRSMKEEKLLQFFVSSKSFSESVREVEFLKNKYPDLIDGEDADNGFFETLYIKL